MKKTGRRKPKKEEGLVLTFDPEERKEFLTGFRKRKLARKAKAREELARQIKIEKARINKDKQEELKKKNELLDEYVKQFVNVNEGDDDTEVVESENQTVTIKKMDINGGDIDFAKLKEQSAEMDGQKAKSVKKNDMQSKKLKKMEAKSQSLKDKKGSKNQRRKKAGFAPKKGGKVTKKTAQKK